MGNILQAMECISLFATDYDGTLLRTDGTFDPGDLQSLEELQRSGCAVILATGRSPFSLKRSLNGRKLPVNGFVLSSGGAVLDGKGAVLSFHTLSPEETLAAHSAFTSLGLDDVSVQGPYPDSHHLHWIPGDHGSDFRRRLELYRGYSREIDSAEMVSSEVIGFAPSEVADTVLERVREKLGERFSVIRATSPIDHRTVWIEIFPAGVDKGHGCDIVRREYGIERSLTAAVGNDWNDVAMLEWASTAFIVENGPSELKAMYRSVPSCDSLGVSTAAAEWLERLS